MPALFRSAWALAKRFDRAKLLAAIGLGLPLLLGVAARADHGLAWDEPIQRRLGRQAWRYVFEDASGYLRSADRLYGPAFELLLAGAERALGVEDSRAAYQLRHLLTFLAFWVGALAYYAVARRLLGSWRLGLVASTMLFLTPRLAADAFYNSKDLPFLAACVIAVWTLLRFLERPTALRGLGHGLACAFATDIRIVGVVLAPLTLVGAIASRREPAQPGLRPLRAATIMAAAYVLCVVALWPYLWGDPVGRFLEAFSVMARFPWHETVLFLGVRTPAPELPWWYLAVWIGISTPASVLLLLPVGAAWAVRRALRSEAGGAPAAVVLAWAALPLASVVALRSVLYDGWRQLYFVYPALLLLALAGARAALQLARDARAGPWARAAGACGVLLLAADVADSASFVVRWHPYQNVYFNRLAGSRASLPERFEVDYWGLCARRLLEDLAAADGRPQLAVLGVEPSVAASAALLPVHDRSRLRFVTDPAEADYVVTHHRFAAPAQGYGEALFSVEVDGMRIGSVFRGRRGTAGALPGAVPGR